MKNRNELDAIKRLVSGAAHVPPSIEVLKSELRSDFVFEPPLPMPPSSLVYLILKCSYHIRYTRLEQFHGFLKDVEEQIVADVKDLKLGASYDGTYAELPSGTLHVTLWSYKTPAAIDKFKSYLSSKPKSALYKNLAKLASFIDDPTIGMHRLVRASTLAGIVTAARKTDPILDIFAANK
jgi:hypothetical protein